MTDNLGASARDNITLSPNIPLVIDLDGTLFRETRYLNRLLTFSIIVFALAGAIALVITGLEKIYFGPQQAQLKREISSLVKEALQRGQRVALDPPLIQAIDDIAVMKQVKLLFFGRPGKVDVWPNDIDILFRAQTEFGSLPEPPAQSELIINAFDSHSLNRFIKPESLNYAVYRRLN